MEAVKAFNLELSSLYEVKPPISKAKMTAITRGAIKAIKFYKHVVQSVEKFILKCKPEYKVPGLYVIDSIVRQSRHQFGPEKDVFAPRFSKNLQQTFVNLFKCPPEDKSKIIRVLNLWQKNQVFPPEVIQPLFDLADPNNPIHQQMQQSTPVQQTNGSQSQVVKGSPALQRTPTKANQTTASEAPTPNLSLTEPVLQQLQQLQRLLSKGADAARPEQVHFDKKLLDFDYGEDEDEVNPSPRPPAPAPVSTDPVTSLLTNPEVLRQLQTLQNTLAGAVNQPAQDAESERIKKMQEMKMQEDEFDKHLAQTVPNLPFASECDFKISQTSTMIGGLHFIPPQPDASQMGQGYDSQHDSNIYGSQNSANDVEVITLDHDDSRSDDDRYKRKRSRSRSRDRGRDKDRRRRSRSRSRSRNRRHRSKSKDRKEKDKKEKEKETERDKERKKRGLPAIKKDHLSVCSTTLWVGHLSKLVHQDDLSNTFGEFGDIVSIDLIVPRGCAFIVMHRRQDAARCLAKLKNHNLHGKAITLAWAPGKGVKGKDLKDYWEGDLGVSYIPWSKLREDMDLEALEDGGMIDEDTMPDWMRKKIEESTKKAAPEQPPFLINRDASNHSTVDTSQPPPLPPTSLMQPPMLPMVNPFQLNNRFLGMIPNLANLPLGVPPPNIAPPNMPPSMMPNLGLGLSSPFQGPPSFMPPTLPPPQTEAKPAPPPATADTKLRNLSESLMNLAGPPLTMPPQIPMNQPPPPLHTTLDDNMDVEMEDAVAHPDLNKPPPNMPLSEQLQASMNASSFNRESRRDESRFSPPRRDGRDSRDRRDDRSSDRSRRRSRSRDRDRDRNDRSGGRDRDRRDRDVRDRDFGRGGRDRDRDRDSRDRRGGDRDRGRWVPPDRRDDRGPPDRRDDRRDGPFDRRGGPPDRRDGPMGRRDDRRDGSYDRSRRDLPDRRDSDPRDKSEREKSLNDRLKEMAGMKFDEHDRDGNRSPRRQLSESKDDVGKDALRFEPPAIMSDDMFANPPPPGVAHARSPTEARNPSPPDFSVQPPSINAANNGGLSHDQSMGPPNSLVDEDTRMQFVNPPPDSNFPGGGDGSEQYDQHRDSEFGHGSYGNNDGYGSGGSAPYNYDGSRPGPYGPPGNYGSDGPGGYGPDGPGQFGPDGPGRFGPDGPRYRDQPPPFGGDSYGPPPDMMMDGPPGFGPDFGPPPGFDGPPDGFMRGGRRGRGRGRGRGRDGPDFFPRDDYGPPMGDEGFGPPMRGDFGSRGPRMRGRGFYNRGGPRGRGGPPFRDGPPGFMPEFEGGPPPDFFRGGPRGRPFGEPFHRGGRGRGFRGGRGRPDFFDGPPPEFFDGPPGHSEGGPPIEGGLPYDDGPPGESPVEFGGRRGRGGRNRSSRWGSNEDYAEPPPNAEGGGGDGGGTPLRDEIDDCGPQDNFDQHHDEIISDAGATPAQEPHEEYDAACEEQGGEEGGDGEGEGDGEVEGEAEPAPEE